MGEEPSLGVRPADWLGVLLVHLAIGLTLLGCGGDPGWWQGWVYAVLLVIAGIGGRVWAERRHPGLMAERLRTRSLAAADVEAWDKVLGPLMALSLSFPLVIVAGVDHRLGWSPEFPAWVNVVGLALIASGYTFSAWAIAENRFFSTLMCIQTDRGHVVCDSGPYRVVRHPGYAGNLLALPGIVLALDTAWVIVPALIALVIGVVRTVREDRALDEGLAGYQEYASWVRYRLIPGIY